MQLNQNVVSLFLYHHLVIGFPALMSAMAYFLPVWNEKKDVFQGEEAHNDLCFDTHYIIPRRFTVCMTDVVFLTWNFSMRFLRWLSTVCGLIKS